MKPYINYSKKELLTMMLNHRVRMNMPEVLDGIIMLAFTDKAWNPPEDFDGCTLVQDFTHPDLACFIHDYFWVTNKGGNYSNKIFKKLMILEGVPKRQAQRRYLAVSIAWHISHRWKKRTKSNIKLSEIKEIIGNNI